MKKIYFLVYQGAIANVFEAEVKGPIFINHKRVLQDSFNVCEIFCRGVKQVGAQIKSAWCNEAGDITGSLWHFSNFQNAPFNNLFSPEFTKEN